MSKQWYITVGLMGGEYAGPSTERVFDEVSVVEAREVAGAYEHKYVHVLPDGVTIRPAPPETAEWLDAEMHDSWEMMRGGSIRMKAPGGWIYRRVNGAGEANNIVFVPVALTSGITVLEADDETA